MKQKLVVRPKTTKGTRTRQLLKATARAKFADVGYQNTRITDITKATGLASGTFYRYFSGKEHILFELLEDLLGQVLREAREQWDVADPLRSITVTTEKYLAFYEENSDLYALLIEMAQVDESVEQIWAESRKVFYERIARMLTRASEHGLLRPHIKPSIVGPLLGGMTEHYAYLRFVLHRVDLDPLNDVTEQITLLWRDGLFAIDARPGDI